MRWFGSPPTPERSAVDKAFFAPVQVFADVLSPKRRRSEISAQLISGWMLYEARRRIGDAIVLNDGRDGRDGRDGSVWIRAESELLVVDSVAPRPCQRAPHACSA